MGTVDGWVTKRFDEIGTIFSGSTPSTTVRAFWDGKIVWVTPYDLSRLNTPYLSDSAKRITEKGLDGCSAHLLPAGSIIMSSRAPIGYVAIPIVEFCTNQGCKSIKLHDDFDSEFTYYNILFNINKVKNLGEGTTFAEISKAALSKVELDFPLSKTEQTKIAEILSTVDRAIEQTEALIAKQQRIKTGLMQDLLTRGIDEHGNLRSERTHKFKDSPLGRIPVEWEVERLETLTIRIGDGIHTTPIYSENTEFFFINGNNLGDGSIHLFSNTLCVDKKEYKKYLIDLNEHTILYSINGTVGNIALYNNETVILGKSAAYINCKNTINTHFIYYALQSDYVKYFYDYEMTGSTIKNLSLAAVRATAIKIPLSESEQELIVEKLDLLSQSIADEKFNLSKLRSLKNALMQDLLTGKMRVTGLMHQIGGASCATT